MAKRNFVFKGSKRKPQIFFDIGSGQTAWSYKVLLEKARSHDKIIIIDKSAKAFGHYPASLLKDKLGIMNKHPDINPVLADAEDLAFSKSSVADFLVMHNLFGQNNPPSIEKSIAAAARVLKKGGYLHLIETNTPAGIPFGAGPDLRHLPGEIALAIRKKYHDDVALCQKNAMSHFKQIARQEGLRLVRSEVNLERLSKQIDVREPDFGSYKLVFRRTR